jgi:tetratricopeptide (TPR) repeat protein
MIQSTLSKICLSVFFAILLFTGDLYAQTITTPNAPSPAAKVSQTIGISEISIEYSRPAVREREVWGTLAHYGYVDQGFGPAKAAPWRAGANDNTIITFSDDAMVEGKSIPAGSYGFFIGVYEDGTADIIFSKNHSSWGSYSYNQDEDQLRVKVNTASVPHTERLTFDFVDISDTGATVVLDWEKKRFPFKVEFDVHEIVLANARNELRSITGFGWQGYTSAANYCLQNNINHEEALSWIDKAVVNTKNFNTLWVKAQLVDQMGKDSGPMYDEAAQMANNAQLNFVGYTVMGKGNHAKALEYFKLNTERNPNDPNTFDSLGECYKTMGEKKLAIKAFKKSLSMNPPANIKENSIKLLKELGVDTSEYEG